LQGGDSQELTPFVSVAKGWDVWHFLGAMSGRIPTNHHDANYSLVWNLHLDYELTETFRPLIEVHDIHWLSNADRLPLGEDYLDVSSHGASPRASSRSTPCTGARGCFRRNDRLKAAIADRVSAFRACG